MYPFIVALHVVLCVLLILIIILQPGKGGDVGAAFGGGSSSSMFGPRGPTSLLQRGTTAVAVLFMVTSITLALFSNRAVLNSSDVGNLLADDAVEDSEDDDDAPSLDVAPSGGSGAAPGSP